MFLALTVLDAVLVVVPPLLMKRLVDVGIADEDVSMVVWLAVGIALAPSPTPVSGSPPATCPAGSARA